MNKSCFLLLQCFQNFAKPSALRWNPKIRQWFSWCCFGCKNMHCVITTWTLDMSWSWCGQNFPGPGNQWVSCDWNHWWDSCNLKSWHMYGEMWGTFVPPDISLVYTLLFIPEESNKVAYLDHKEHCLKYYWSCTKNWPILTYLERTYVFYSRTRF